MSRDPKKRSRWTAEEIEFLSGHRDTPREELTKLFSERFHPVERHAIASCMVYRGFLMAKSEGWHREAGRKSRPVGTTFIADGFVRVRTENGWRYLHKENWEKENGPIPAGSVLIPRNGDRGDCRPENWRLITKSERALLISSPVQMSGADTETRDALISLAKLKSKIKQKAK